MNRKRAYEGQFYTTYGTRGKTEVKGLTMRDIADCFVLAFADSSYPQKDTDGESFYDKAQRGEFNRNDLYKLDLNGLDPGAIQQNLGCRIEKMMNIFPNIPDL